MRVSWLLSPGSSGDDEAAPGTAGLLVRHLPSYDEVANIAAFAASDWARTITASEINFTGGEPTIHEGRFIELMRVCSNLLPATAVHILSNGIRPGIAGMFKTLAGDLAKDGITVNMVLPGRIRTDRFIGHQTDLAARAGISLEEWIATRSTPDIPMGRIGTPEEFGDMVVFLGSERASYVTGCVVQVDGGLIKSVV